MNKFKLIRGTISAILLTATLSGCSKFEDCDINENHVHFYRNDDFGLVRLIDSEKKNVMGYKRTDAYCYFDEKSGVICENNLYRIVDNASYIKNAVSNAVPYRETLQPRLRYSDYYGYGYGFFYDQDGNKIYDYGYGPQKGLNYNYGWDPIEFYEYSEYAVRDVTYKYTLYKIDENGDVVSSVFDNIEDAPSDYKYFNPDDLIVTCLSDQYYLDVPKKC